MLSAQVCRSFEFLCLMARGNTYFLFWWASTLSVNIKSSISSTSSLVKIFMIKQVHTIQCLECSFLVCKQHYQMLLYIQCIATWWKNQTRVQSNLAKNCIADLSPLANVNGFFALNTHLIQSSLDSRTVMDKLQHVLNAAAHVVTGTWKSGRGLSQIMHDELHWLDVPDRVFFKLAVTVNRCLNGRAVGLLRSGCRCQHSAAPAFRQPSTACSPRYRLNTYNGRAFLAAGPTIWNSLPDFIQDRTIRADSFRSLLKTHLFARY